MQNIIKKINTFCDKIDTNIDELTNIYNTFANEIDFDYLQINQITRMIYNFPKRKEKDQDTVSTEDFEGLVKMFKYLVKDINGLKAQFDPTRMTLGELKIYTSKIDDHRESDTVPGILESSTGIVEPALDPNLTINNKNRNVADPGAQKVKQIMAATNKLIGPSTGPPLTTIAYDNNAPRSTSTILTFLQNVIDTDAKHREVLWNYMTHDSYGLASDIRLEYDKLALNANKKSKEYKNKKINDFIKIIKDYQSTNTLQNIDKFLTTERVGHILSEAGIKDDGDGDGDRDGDGDGDRYIAQLLLDLDLNLAAAKASAVIEAKNEEYNNSGKTIRMIGGSNYSKTSSNKRRSRKKKIAASSANIFRPILSGTVTLRDTSNRDSLPYGSAKALQPPSIYDGPGHLSGYSVRKSISNKSRARPIGRGRPSNVPTQRAIRTKRQCLPPNAPTQRAIRTKRQCLTPNAPTQRAIRTKRRNRAGRQKTYRRA
jgi:hypothetical protein